MEKTLMEQTLNERFGHNCFRPLQEDIIRNLLDGRDVLALLPTGGGKSLCYQFPAAVLPGITLVISPLISLMKDQVDSLKASGLRAVLINSTLTERQLRLALEAIEEQPPDLLYIAPERLKSDEFIARLNRLTISCIAVDEAHCIAQWGHDFRPSYRKIGRLLESLGQRPPLAAFTATATPIVRQEIIERLGLQDPACHQADFNRPNLRLDVIRDTDRQKWLLHFFSSGQETRPAVIYCTTRKEAQSVRDLLLNAGHPCGMYHGGLRPADRQQVQEDFLDDRIPLLVATNAFGMGIDKPDIRTVIHYNMPRDLESYYQEAGRAGRDGKPSRCILLYGPADPVTHRQLIHQVTYNRQKHITLEKLETMIAYCHTDRCLRTVLLEYFGQAPAVPCGDCSNCLDDTPREDITRQAQMILSTVHYTKGRFGAATVAAVLKGSRSASVRQKGLDRLSTHGLLKSEDPMMIRRYINILVSEGYLARTSGRFPLLQLTARSSVLLRGETRLTTRHHLKGGKP